MLFWSKKTQKNKADAELGSAAVDRLCFPDIGIGPSGILAGYNFHRVYGFYISVWHTEFGEEPHKVSGMLLYAATDEAIQPDNSYQMSGNKISVKTLDLNRDFSEIAAQLNAIVAEHFS